MKYRPNGMMMWDTWCINVNGKVHAFHLNFLVPNSPFTAEDAACMGHAISTDLLNWDECERILPPNHEKNPIDSEQKWTGSVVEKDNQFYLFYTMRDSNNNQRIGLAISDNLVDFKEYEGNPVLVPDKDYFLSYDMKKRWTNTTDCRDMLVIKDPGSDGYFGYFVVCADLGGASPKGVIGYAFSDDLIHWEQKGIAFEPDFNGTIEVPDVYCLNGKWYLTILSGTWYGGRGVFHEDGLESGTIYTVSDAPDKPFACSEDNVLMGGSYNSCGYSVRSIDFEGKKYALYVTKEFGKDSLSLPKRIDTLPDGRLRLFYDDLLKSIRTNILCNEKISAEIMEHPQTSFAWQTKGGLWQRNGNNYLIITDKNSWQSALLSAIAKNIELSAYIALNKARAAGFVINSGNGENVNRYVIFVEKAKNRVVISRVYDFGLKEKREYDFSQQDGCHLRVMVVDHSCDVYIDDIFVLNIYFDNLGSNTAGVFADDGETEINDLEIYELKD